MNADQTERNLKFLQSQGAPLGDMSQEEKDAGGHWVTMSGTPVLLSGSGEVMGGAGGKFSGFGL